MRSSLSPLRGRRAARVTTSGTSLVEVLVVIVVFLVGILAVVQIFPRGFRVLIQTRNSSIATSLTRAEVERLKARPDQLPEQILPVEHVFVGSSVVIRVDEDRRPGDLGPGNEAQLLRNDGVLIDGASNELGDWQYLGGANGARRVVGEGRRVPAPRQVGAPNSDFFGGLMLLQFGPVVSNPALDGLFIVYGNDMVRRFGDPGGRAVRPFEFFLDNADGEDGGEPTLYLPVPSGDLDGDNDQDADDYTGYRVTLSAYVGGRKIDYVSTLPVQVGPGDSGVVLVSSLLGGDNPDSVEYESVRVARVFRKIPTTSDFTPLVSAGGMVNPYAPYQYKLLDETLGILLFNPSGYNYQERRGGGRVPLQARVDYDVYDWRIIRDEFRVSDLTVPATHRLALGNLKVGGNGGPDGRPLTGIFLEANGETSDPRSDHFVLVDTETGGLVYEKDTSGRLLVRVDKSLGLVTFNDSDNNAANGLTGQLRLPDGTTQSVEMSGRNLRALYMANDEWSVQALKSAAIYRVTYARPAPAQYYVGGTNGALGGGATRVYFPVPDTGRKVSIGEIFYRDSNNNIQIIESQDFVIGASPADPIGLPYIDIKEVAPDAVSFDFTYGYAVRNIRGASIVVRVLWNPQRFALSGDNAQNMRRLDEWGRGWRRTVTETYLQRGDAIR